MAEHQHRATAEHWDCVKRLASNGNVAYSAILELLHRIEALEAATTEAKPDSSLVERVAFAIVGDSDGLINWKPEARAAIREVAAWLRERAGYGGGFWSQLLQQEAER